MSLPKISVCVDVFNYASFLPEAVDSIFSQDFEDFEVLIGDDASTDDSFEIASSYASKDRRVQAFRNPENLGMIKNRNACLRRARGEYIKILHADDFLNRTDALGLMASMLDDHPGMSLVASAMRVTGAVSKHKQRFSYFPNQGAQTGTCVITRCLKENRNLIGPPSATMFRRARGLRGFDESFFNSADWEMWLHLLERGCFGFLEAPLVCYRKHESQQTEKDKLTLSESEDRLAILDRYLDKPYIRLPQLCKDHLRHCALANQLRCSRRLGVNPGKAILSAEEAFRFHSFAPVSAVMNQGLKFSRILERSVPGIRSRRSQAQKSSPLPAGVNVAGFFQGEYGVGDASRAICELIRQSTIPSAFVNITSRNHRNLDRSIVNFSEANPYSVNLMTFSFDYARRFYRDKGPAYFKDRHNIGLWFWELEHFPPRWHDCFEYYDEIWTCTSFCQKAFEEVAPIPVHQIGYPLPVIPIPEPDRKGFGVNPDAFVFLFNFDFHSVVERKNPEALISAFRSAFDAEDDHAVLIIKSINSAHHPERLAALTKLAEGLNIHWINEHLAGARMMELFSTADCYISLHRSEGLGLGMARAMSFGKPVIATGYSGNLDFTTPETALLVRYQLAEIPQNFGVYEKGNLWAEADPQHAAELMRWVVANPDQAADLGRKGRAAVEITMNPSTILHKVQKRLSKIDRSGFLSALA